MPGTPFEIRNAYGDVIRGDVHRPAGLTQTPVVVILHGFKGFKDWGFIPYVAEEICNGGFTAVRFNCSHNGIGNSVDQFTELEKFAENTISNEIADIRAVLNEIEQNTTGLFGDVYPGAIGLLGHSRGGGTAILAAVDDPRILAVVGWAAVSTFNRLGMDREQWRREGRIQVKNSRTGQDLPLNYSFIEDLERHPEEYDVIKSAKKLKAALLLVHAEDDATVPIEEMDAIFQGSNMDDNRYYRMSTGGHTFGATHPFQSQTQDLQNALIPTLDWFERHLNA